MLVIVISGAILRRHYNEDVSIMISSDSIKKQILLIGNQYNFTVIKYLFNIL